MKYIKKIHTKIGNIQIIEEESQIIEIKINAKLEEKAMEKNTPNLEKTAKQLIEYLEGNRKKFDVPFNPKGTKFMQQVWTALQEIPYGEVRSYSEIAKRIGNPKSARAVGMANHRNPIPIIIPCHRVIEANGKLGGYALGIENKEFLLQLEKQNKKK
ncbi:MAG: methylated-DNA--[protein]-cysteine S-methyltransferase [Clostridia bacterium]|nr:methylated-DNA--[protein]-cysteine S-methyltransferase [Clostridia bacterium]